MPFDDDIDFSIRPPSEGGDYNLQVRNYSPGTANFSNESCGHELLVSVPFEKSYPALLRFLGFAEVCGTYLHRSLPLRSSDFDWLWCTKVGSSQDMKFLDKFEAASDDQPDGARYQITRMHLIFEPLPYAVLDDDEVDGEWQRFCEINFEPGIEVLTAEVGTFFFREGDPGTPGPDGKPVAFPGRLPLITPKGVMTIMWRKVPAEYVLDADGFPANLMKCMGRVNATDFLGAPAGTLLMDPPKLQKYVMNLRSQGAIPVGQPAFYYDVLLAARYFDPPKGVPGSAYRGHQLAPWLRDGKYYYISRSDNSPVYPSIDFATAFQQPESDP
jgi:hypothetical protein